MLIHRVVTTFAALIPFLRALFLFETLFDHHTALEILKKLFQIRRTAPNTFDLDTDEDQDDDNDDDGIQV